MLSTINTNEGRRTKGGWLARILAAACTVAISLAGCGGGGAGGYGGDGGVGGASASKLTISLSKSQLQSGTVTDSVDITILAQNSSNQAVQGVAVALAADSGLLTVPTPSSTGSGGTLKATLTAGGDRSNRTIKITATAGTLSAVATVAVVGTTVTVQGPTSVGLSAAIPLTITVKDSASQPIGGAAVTITSSNGNTVPTGVTTDGAGVATASVMGVNAGTDIITIAAAGAIAQQTVAVSSSSTITFSVPQLEQNLSTSQTITLSYMRNGVAQAGKVVNVTTTRGVLSTTSVTTSGAGTATFSLLADTVGPVQITATSTDPADPISGSVRFETVSPTPGTFSIQANPSQIGTNPTGSTSQQSTILVIVRDGTSQAYPVKNALVEFRIKTDPSSGQVLSGSALTDSTGSATTIYVAGPNPSGTDQVEVEAVVSKSGITLAAQSVKLTVAQVSTFVRLGFDNTISKDATTHTYTKPYTAIVSDTAGNAVKDAVVTVRLKPVSYGKGFYTVPADKWAQTLTATCANEDLNFNGVLDPSIDFDENGNGTLEPGLPVTVSFPNGSRTDSTGLVVFNLVYPQNYGSWATFEIEARSSVSGTEGSARLTETLGVAAADVGNKDVSPPFVVSPYGVAAVCSNPN